MSDAAFLAEVDGFLASCGTSPLLPSGTPAGEASRTSSAENKSYYRIRQLKRENLRRQVTELTAELNERLKAAEPAKMQPCAKWMAMAKYHQEERENAEAEQRRLCAAIDARAALIQDFFKLTQDRLSELGSVTQEEVRLLEGGAGAAPCCIEQDFGQPEGFFDAFAVELEGEAWRDSGQTGTEAVDDLQNTNCLDSTELAIEEKFDSRWRYPTKLGSIQKRRAAARSRCSLAPRHGFKLLICRVDDAPGQERPEEIHLHAAVQPPHAVSALFVRKLESFPGADERLSIHALHPCPRHCQSNTQNAPHVNHKTLRFPPSPIENVPLIGNVKVLIIAPSMAPHIKSFVMVAAADSPLGNSSLTGPVSQ
jgi:hypothetical protein